MIGVNKMLLLIILLIFIICILFTFIFKYKKDIKYISEQINASRGEYTNIRMKSLDKDIENLVICINDLYEKNQKINNKIKRSDEQLKLSVANMSHDLRTPLTSVMGYIQLLKDEGLTNEERGRYIDVIEKRTIVLHQLITSFYDLSRIEADEYKFDLKLINLSNMLYEAVALFYNDFTNKNIEPEIKVDDNASIIADEKAVMRIFTNLINNMLKHGEKDAKIVLTKDRNYITTEFANTAPRLTEEDLEHIFDRFFTGDSTRNDKNTGIGLSITKAFVEQLGHRIEASMNNGILSIKIIWNRNISFNDK